ncbi:MAG: hypothetical protein ACRC20_06320 [Segniliparus sp.]|uniref:hypothetical protein n=1 Tax=Segniliparus sp. TaxID=2804064 RepID=UPI003F376A2F
MADVELSREDAALILNDFDTAIEELREIVEFAQKLETPPDAFGSGAEGKKSQERARLNGENIAQYAKDTLAATLERKKAAEARIHAIFGADFDSKTELAKINPNAGNQGHLTGFE